MKKKLKKNNIRDGNFPVITYKQGRYNSDLNKDIWKENKQYLGIGKIGKLYCFLLFSPTNSQTTDNLIGRYNRWTYNDHFSESPSRFT